MTLFLQYNVNNHILDGAGRLWWPCVLLVLESVCTEQGCTEFRTPLCVILATPLIILQIIKFGISKYLHLCVEAGFSQIQSHLKDVFKWLCTKNGM